MTTTEREKIDLQSLISKDYVAVSGYETVGKTIELLRRHKEGFQNKFAYLYVIDEKEK